MPSPMFSFRCPPPLRRALVAWGKREGIEALGGIVVTILLRYLNQPGPAPRPTGRRGLATGVWR